MKRFGKIKLFTLATLMLLSSCGKGEKAATTTVKEEKPKVKLASVRAENVEQLQEFTATVESDVKNNIAPSSPVRIEKIYVEVGDQVRKGQKFVQMDASSLNQIKSQLDNQKIEFARIDELYKVGGASKSEWDAKKMNLDVMQTSYRNLLRNTSLTSPISGVVTARNYDSGDMYSGGLPVLTVEKISPVKLMINISEDYFTKVKKRIRKLSLMYMVMNSLPARLV
jgi:RND family efflux transporter MFP subunit